MLTKKEYKLYNFFMPKPLKIGFVFLFHFGLFLINFAFVQVLAAPSNTIISTSPVKQTSTTTIKQNILPKIGTDSIKTTINDLKCNEENIKKLDAQVDLVKKLKTKNIPNYKKIYEKLLVIKKHFETKGIDPKALDNFISLVESYNEALSSYSDSVSDLEDYLLKLKDLSCGDFKHKAIEIRDLKEGVKSSFNDVKMRNRSLKKFYTEDVRTALNELRTLPPVAKESSSSSAVKGVNNESKTQ